MKALDRERSPPSPARAGTGATSSTPSSCCAPTGRDSRVVELPGDRGRAAARLAPRSRAVRCARSSGLVRLRLQLWRDGTGGDTRARGAPHARGGTRDRRFAASLSRHPVPAHAVGEAAGEHPRGVRGRRSRPVGVLRLAALRRRAATTSRTRSRAILDPAVLLGMTAVSVVGGIPGGRGRARALDVRGVACPAPRSTPVVAAARPVRTAATSAACPSGRTAGHARAARRPVQRRRRPRARPRWRDDAPGSHGDRRRRVVRPRGPGGNRLLLGGPGTRRAAVRTDGAVGVADRRRAGAHRGRLAGVPAGRQPVRRHQGRSGNRIEELGGRPALERLQECAAGASADDLELLRTGGCTSGWSSTSTASSSGAATSSCATCSAPTPTPARWRWATRSVVGQTVQFHVRDADRRRRGPPRAARRVDDAAGALLFTCNGRGRAFFGEPRPRRRASSTGCSGRSRSAGAFCAGEIGPVGGRNFLHSYTASLALFG